MPFISHEEFPDSDQRHRWRSWLHSAPPARVSSASPIPRRKTIRPCWLCSSWPAWSRSGPRAVTASACSTRVSSGEEKDTIEQTRVGAIDLNRTNVAPIGSLIPAANVLALPFLFRSFNHLHKVLDHAIGDEILAGSQRHGFVGLTFYDSGSRSIYNSVRPVRSLADMKGLRIRVQQSELMFDMIKALGAEPVELPYGQVLTGLSTRLIDGAENNWPSYVTTSHYKLAPYYTLTEHTMGPEVLVMSLRAWESLSTEDREIFRDAARKSSMFMRELWSGLEERSRQQARAAGNTIIADFDRKPFETAMGTIYAKAVTDPDLRQLIERIRQVQ
mgnify:CR=1 FL=1